jgi:hypothetical protein
VVENCYLNWNDVSYSLLHVTSCEGSAGYVEMGDVRFWSIGLLKDIVM